MPSLSVRECGLHPATFGVVRLCPPRSIVYPGHPRLCDKVKTNVKTGEKSQNRKRPCAALRLALRASPAGNIRVFAIFPQKP